MSKLTKRIGSSLLLLAMLLALVIGIPYGDIVLFAIIMVFCLYEMGLLLQLSLPSITLPAVGLSVYLMIGYILSNISVDEAATALASTIITILLLLAVLFRTVHLSTPLSTMGGIFVMTSASASIFYLHTMPDHLFWLLFILCMIWASDIGGYFLGRQWGRRPFAPMISPKKTWAGFWGGLIGSLLVALVGMLCFNQVWTALGLALIVHIATVTGDLAASKIKRLTHSKDSSQLIPGHGGFLDRCDGLLLAMPIAVFIVRFLMK